ncbi:MAG TPA: prephenate dehydratase [Polyangia bacterium]
MTQPAVPTPDSSAPSSLRPASDNVAFTFAFQGERGAFSEDAGQRFFGDAATALAAREFEDLFAAVETGKAEAAVVPVENTLAGAINQNLDLLLERDLTIVGEVVLRVVHNVIGLPGVRLAEVRRVHSHPVALAQCERFLREHPGIEALAAYDTAGSVKSVMAAGRREEAAIAGASAAKVYGAEILVPGVESSPQNFTRFVIVTRPDPAATRSRAAGPAKTSLVVRLSHQPGGLHRALGVFADEGINLTKIESRPIAGRPFEYSFYLDFLGGPEDKAAARALARLATVVESIKVLGSYPRAETPAG